MSTKNNQAILIADLGYGDAGKGSLVDFLTRTTQAHTVVRYNGGSQAAHNVITPGGRHHTFSQFGSGTFIPGTQTCLSRFMIAHPPAMLAEERHLQSLGISDAFARMHIDRRALITTPFQQSANRVKEIARGGARHGSCGLGVGETMSDWLAFGDESLFAGDLGDRAAVTRKLARLRDAKFGELQPLIKDLPASDQLAQEMQIFEDPGIIAVLAELFAYFAGLVRLEDERYFAEMLRQPGTVIFEGAQGVLLDEWYGFYPYNTWSTLTFKNADTLLTENDFDGQSLKLGLMRAYATRHGAGPFVSEDRELSQRVPDNHNINNPWQREFRVGRLDFVALQYALRVCGGLDGLVVSHLDRLAEMPDALTCDAYLYSGHDPAVTDYFRFENGVVKEILVSDDPTDLEKQAALTRLLCEMQPVYTACAKEQPALLQRISQTLGLPIAVTSSGASALDKEIRLFHDFLYTLDKSPQRMTRRSSTHSRAPLADAALIHSGSANARNHI
jgi:adenylosuccinate synthase